MLSVTVDSTLAWLIPFAADWSTAPVSAFELLTAGDEGRSAREHRHALSATLRTTLQYSAQLTPGEADQFLAALAVEDNRPLLAPFWPAESSFAGRTLVAITGGLRVWFEPDWSVYRIGLDTESNPSGYSAAARTAPLLWAQWGKRPSEETLTADGELDVVLELTEDGPAGYALVPQGGALVYGAAVGGVATPKLPAEYVDWTKPTASSEIAVSAERIGYGRGKVQEYIAQQPRQTQKLAVRCLSCDEIARLVRIFLDRRGDAGAWWCPSFRSADADDFILARFKSARLQLTWGTPTQADAQLEVIAVPTEQVLPAGETRGTTIGDLGTPIWLYHITDGDLTWRFTSFESAINAGALGTFTPRPIDHGDITSEINLQRHDVDLTVGWFAGSPFERARLDRMAPPLTVRIYEGKLSAPTAAELIFTGRAAGYQYQGGKCTCKIAGPTALFDVRGPVAVTSPRCWTPMYSPLCGLSREALSVAADLVGIDSDGTLRFEIPAIATMPADHFRYGYAERVLADGSRRRYRVSGSGEYINDVVIPSLPGSLQAETTTWQTGLAAAGGTLGTHSLAIADALVVALKARSYVGKLRYLMPLLGGDLAAAVQPLWDPSGYGRPTIHGTTITFDESLGTTGSVAQDSSSIELPLKTTNLGADHSGGLGIWLIASPQRYMMFTTSTANPIGRLCRLGMAPERGVYLAWDDQTNWAVSSDYILSHYYGQRSSTSRRQLFRAGALLAENTAEEGPLMEPGVFNFFLHGVGYGPYTDRGSTYGCAYMTDGTMTEEEVADFHALLRSALMLPTRRIGAAQGISTDRPVAAPASYPEPGWTLVPGCSHSWTRCKQLGNSDNFRGCPHFPKSNPAMVSVKQETSAGSKK